MLVFSDHGMIFLGSSSHLFHLKNQLGEIKKKKRINLDDVEEVLGEGGIER